ncbi:gas vesicle protein [Salinibacter ruber]|nr:gas vesicle protein [Salinibacter ruber]
MEASTLFAAISAAAAAVSALFLYLSARASIKSNRNEKRLSEAEIKHKYYDEMVLSRVLPTLDRFRKSSKQIVRQRKNEIEEMHNNDASSPKMHSKVKSLGNDFQDVRSSAVNEISEYLDAWGEDKLRKDVREVAENMEDEVAPMFENLIYRDSDDPDIEGMINEKTGKIERIIRDNDPFLSRFKNDE